MVLEYIVYFCLWHPDIFHSIYYKAKNCWFGQWPSTGGLNPALQEAVLRLVYCHLLWALLLCQPWVLLTGVPCSSSWVWHSRFDTKCLEFLSYASWVLCSARSRNGTITFGSSKSIPAVSASNKWSWNHVPETCFMIPAQFMQWNDKAERRGCKCTNFPASFARLGMQFRAMQYDYTLGSSRSKCEISSKTVQTITVSPRCVVH